MDNLLGGIVSEEGSLADLDVKLQNSMDLIENLSDSLNKVGHMNVADAGHVHPEKG